MPRHLLQKVAQTPCLNYMLSNRAYLQSAAQRSIFSKEKNSLVNIKDKKVRRGHSPDLSKRFLMPLSAQSGQTD